MSLRERARWIPLGLGSVVVLFGLAGDALAQPATSDDLPEFCERECAPELRDAHGCCHAPRPPEVVAAEREEAERQAAEAARLAKLDEEKRRGEAEAAARVAAARDEERRALEAVDAVAAQKKRRTVGLGLMIGGGVGVISSGLFMGLGAATNSQIRSGNFATAGDIQATANSGKTYNTIATVSGVVGGIALAVGVPLWFLNAEKSTAVPASAWAVAVTPGGAAVRGNF